MTGMKSKKGEVNQYANQSELFHRKKTTFGVDTCMTSIFLTSFPSK